MGVQPPITPSAWDRVVSAAAHPVRALAMMIAVGAAVGGVGGASGVLVGSLAVVMGLLAGELAGRSRVRTPWLIGAALAALFAAWTVRAVVVGWSLVPSLFGPAFALWAALLLGLGATVAAVVGALRLLACRGPAFAAVELGLLAALLAGTVASHRDGSVARPLWLSDLSWSFGVDPGRVLLAGGGLLTALLAGLLLLGSERRKPGVGLLALPVLAVVAWLLVTRWSPLDPPDPLDVLGLGDGGDQGGGGELDGQAPPRPPPKPGEGPPQPPPKPGEGPPQPPPEPGEGPPQPPPKPGEGTPQPKDPKDTDDGEQPPPKEAPNPLDGGGGGGNGPVAVVVIDDDHTPVSGVWYLRQGVLPSFNGTRLIESQIPGAEADVSDHFAVAVEDLPFTAPLVGLDGTPVRDVLHGSVALLVDHPEPFAPEAAVQYAPRGNPNPARFVRSYAFVAHVQSAPYDALVGRPLGDPAWSSELRAEYLEVPPDPRYGELARAIVAGLPPDLPPERAADPFVRAAAVTGWIGANMKYSKAERHADAADPTADFLFGNRIGYCVHTAHSSVYLWRSLGIPSRVAVGYAVLESARRGSTMVVMAGDAHAWPELYVDGVGWVPLDVSPAETLDPPADPPDEDEISTLGEMARAPVEAADDGPRPDYSWIWSWLGWTGGGLLTGLVVVVLAAHYAVKLWRRAAPLWAGPASLSKVGYRTALELLAEAGHVRTPGETREAFSRRLSAQVPALERITALHLRGALGRVAPDDPERRRSEWAALLLRLRHELRVSTPWWRRAIGFVDPTSVHRAR